MFRPKPTIASIFVLLALPGAVAGAQTPAAPAAVPAADYQALAGLILRAPVVVDATIRSATRITGAEAAGAAPGKARFYIEADVGGLIRGSTPLPPRVGYLLDVALDARGRPPRLRKLRVLLFARPVPGSANQLQLVAPGAQLDWNPATDQLARTIIRDAIAPDAPPAITGLGNAFHVPGTLPGEGETQVFINTATGDPVSLLILRRPNQARAWSVSLGDIVGEAGRPPERQSLAWYRLACELPRALPAASLANADPGTEAAARDDYAFVLNQLGRCTDPLAKPAG